MAGPVANNHHLQAVGPPAAERLAAEAPTVVQAPTIVQAPTVVRATPQPGAARHNLFDTDRYYS